MTILKEMFVPIMDTASSLKGFSITWLRDETPQPSEYAPQPLDGEDDDLKFANPEDIESLKRDTLPIHIEVWPVVFNYVNNDLQRLEYGIFDYLALQRSLIIAEQVPVQSQEFFTCGCGTASCAGLDSISIVYENDQVSWLFPVADFEDILSILPEAVLHVSLTKLQNCVDRVINEITSDPLYPLTYEVLVGHSVREQSDFFSNDNMSLKRYWESEWRLQLESRANFVGRIGKERYQWIMLDHLAHRLIDTDEAKQAAQHLKQRVTFQVTSTQFALQGYDLPTFQQEYSYEDVLNVIKSQIRGVMARQLQKPDPNIVEFIAQISFPELIAIVKECIQSQPEEYPGQSFEESFAWDPVKRIAIDIDYDREDTDPYINLRDLVQVANVIKTT